MLASIAMPLAIAIGLLAVPGPARAIKVVTWNVTDYPNTNLAARQPSLRTVMADMNPDLVILQELKSEAGRDSFLNNVLNVVQPGQWAATNYLNTCETAFFYKTAVMVPRLSNAVAIPTPSGPRDAGADRFRPVGYTSTLSEFRVYSIHFNAGTEDTASRRLECTELRNNLNLSNPVTFPHFLIGGDTNFYTPSEGGYIRLTESQADNDGRGKDPLTLPATWHQNAAYALYHTQSTCSSGCPAPVPPAGPWSNGGLDDRFDLWLTSYSLQDGEGLDVLGQPYITYGQDGNHYNQAVNGSGFNTAVGITIANALFNSSDHLPVIITLQVPAKVAAVSQLSLGSAIVGGDVEVNLAVGNSALAPADELNYSLVAPAGFTAPAGSFVANVGAPANLHALTMSTATAGVKTGTLTISSDDPDTVSKTVKLSGTVLDHAAASLDPAVVQLTDTIDFGTAVSSPHPDLDACVHNVGWDATQARLEVTGGVITGGAGHFTLVGGFQPAEVAGSPACYTVHFEDAGATPDSTYEATLTFASEDEPLPGTTASPDLVVTLKARVSGEALGAPSDLPGRIAFHAPQPNPLTDETTLRFDLPRPAPVTLEVIDLSGRRVASLADGFQPAGRHQVRWRPLATGDAAPPAGIYFVRFSTPGLTEIRRLVLLR
jgi:endonuclease/exonuclease/phosphatase family metal-dependent hydrolase